jgi:ketosteroid isomerase-like protein
VSEDAAANAALISRFYEAFGRRDHAEMARCYAPNARFSDPAFGELQGAEVPAMWRMLCERGKDLEVRYRDVETHDDRGSAHWDADYTFSATGRKVHNSIDASFRFADGLIAEHDDRFGMWRWSRQALGPTGLFFGWSPVVKKRVTEQARENLSEFMAKEG